MCFKCKHVAVKKSDRGIEMGCKNKKLTKEDLIKIENEAIRLWDRIGNKKFMSEDEKIKRKAVCMSTACGRQES